MRLDFDLRRRSGMTDDRHLIRTSLFGQVMRHKSLFRLSENKSFLMPVCVLILIGVWQVVLADGQHLCLCLGAQRDAGVVGE